jgi:glycine/serine hydroxymethyltransferase
VADWIAEVLETDGAEAVIARVRAGVTELCSRFPVYGD